MIGLGFLASLGALVVVGSALAPPRLSLGNRVVIGTGLIGILLPLEMVALSQLGISWSPIVLLGPLLLTVVIWRRPLCFFPIPNATRRALPGIVAALVGLLFVAYAAASARMTSTDLVLFWGTKGEHFGLARGFDTAFLRDELHRGLHRDYPPLLPCLYAWGVLCVGRLPWGAVLLLLPATLALTGLAFWSGARRHLTARQVAEFTALFVSVFGYCLFVGLTAGNAEAMLLFYEAIALSALAFGVPREDLWMAGVGFAGAVLTKLEGTLFVAVALLVTLSLRPHVRGPRACLALAGPPAAALLVWLAFCRAHGLTEFYRPSTYVTLRFLPTVGWELLRQASYQAFYAPWALLAVAWLGRRQRLASSLPVLVAVGTLLGDASLYRTSPVHPGLWIGWSATRLLLTPLLCLFFAAAAPSSAAIRTELAP